MKYRYKCAWCEKEFETEDVNEMYCSEDCVMADYEENHCEEDWL